MIQYRSPDITVFESALYRTTSTLLELKRAVILVDPTWLPGEVAAIRQYVDERLKGRTLYLLFTHADYDHILGAGLFPEAKVLASRAFAQMNEAQREAQLELIRDFDAKFYCTRSYPLYFPEVSVPLEAETGALELDGHRLLYWPAPGHTAEGWIVYVEELEVLIVGDYLSNVEFPFVYDSFRAYRQTLQELREIVNTLRPKLLVPGHGDLCAETSEMLGRIRDGEAYLDDLAGDEDQAARWLDFYPFGRGLADEHARNVQRFRETNKDGRR